MRQFGTVHVHFRDLKDSIKRNCGSILRNGNNSWDVVRYALEKRKFVAARLRYRFIGAHTWMIFSATWAVGWGVSALLLGVGMKNMPLRYGLALGVGNWKMRLLRNTAPFAFAVMMGLVAIAAGMQNRAPGATTFAQACRVLYLQSAHSRSR